MNISPSSIVRRLATSSCLKSWASPLGVFILALVPRLVDLSARPFWLDEVYTYQRASLAPGALMLDSFQNHHMPSFFLLLSPLVALGNPQFWLRLPSAVFGAVAVALVFVIARRIAGQLAGVLAALILGLSPTVLAFAQEARSYTLVMTLVLVALYGVVRLAQDLPAAGHGFGAAKTGWLCFVLGTAAALDVLGDGVPWLIAANLIFLCLAFIAPARGRFLRQVALADLVVAVLSVPLYALLLHYEKQTVVVSLGWIPKLDAGRIWYNLGAVYLMHVADWVSYRLLNHHDVPGLVWLIDALLLLALAVGVWRLRRRPSILIILGIAFLFLPCLFLILSIWHPMLLPRYLLWSAAPFAILTGIGAATLLEGRQQLFIRLAVAGVAAVLLANLLPYYLVETKPRWDIAARLLAGEVNKGDVVYLSDTGARQILRHYMPIGAQPAVLDHSLGDLAQAELAFSQCKRVWVVYGHAGQNTSTPKRFFAPLHVLGAPSLVQAAGSRIIIMLYNPQANLASCTKPSQ